MDEQKERNAEKRYSSSEALNTLVTRWKNGTFGEILDDWKWIISFGKGYELRIVLFTLIGIAGSTFGIVSAVANKYVIDIVTGRQIHRLWVAIAITLGSTLLGLLLSNVMKRVSFRLSADIHKDVQEDIYSRFMNARWEETSRFDNGDILSRFNNDIETVSSNAVSWLPSIIIAVYNFVATFFVIWHYSRVMSLIALASAPVLLLASRTLIGKQRYYGKKQKEFRSRIVSFESESLYNLDTVKSFGVEFSFIRRFRRMQEDYKALSLENNAFHIRTNILLSLLSMAISFAAFGYSLYLLWTDLITYGTMVLFLQQRSNLSSAFSNVVGIIPSFVGSSVSAHRIRELAELEAEEHAPAEGKTAERPAGGLSVCLRDVSFAYTDGAPVLSRVCLEAAPGQIVALIGPSGEGKTTVFRLMLGLVRPASGVCELRTESGRTIAIDADSRALFSYIPQGNTLIAGTIAENMRYVKEDATDAEIEEALRTACAWEFVSKLPEGIDSRVGARGKGLSEGQAQRLSIARALLRNAPVLLLDEATSALDAETEKKVLDGILRRSPDRTILIATHRTRALTMCDRVYRMTGGNLMLLRPEDMG